MTQPFLTAVILLSLVCPGFAQADEKFAHVAVYFEQNVTDQDAEVKFEAVGPDTGVATLKVMAPDGRTVIDFKAPDSKMGLRHFNLESPEPENEGKIQKDFPEGEYTFIGSTVTGVALRSIAMLRHTLPEVAAFVRPRPEEKNVPIKGLKIQWHSVKNLAAHIIEIEQEETSLKLVGKLPGTVTTFAVPDGFLNPATEYKLAIGTVTKEGNTSFVETAFKTAVK